MATNAQAIVLALAAADKYNDVNNVTVSLTHKVKTWSDAEVFKIPIHDARPMSDEACSAFGEYFMECLTEGKKIDSDLLMVMLHLAISLRSPDDLSAHVMDPPRRKKEYNYIPSKLITIDREDELNDKEDEQLLIIQRVNAAAAAEAQAEEVKAEGNGSGIDTASEDDEDDLQSKAAAYAYVAAYLFRLQCRQVENVHGNLGKAIERFNGWYDKGANTISGLNIPRSSLESMRNVIARRPEVVGTWVMWLANAENENKGIPKQSKGLLDYLGIQIFAYQGMHVVTQVLTIQQISKIPLGMLLRELDCPITRAGVKEVYNIVKNYEITDTNPTRTTFFRFSRVWDTGFFTNVQSKNCAPLLYVAAKTVKDISSSTISDPTKIYAVQHLGDSMRQTLDKASKKLVAIILEKTTQDEESGEMWATDTPEDKK